MAGQVDVTKACKSALWAHKHLRRVLASLAGQGKMDGLEAMELLEGLDGLAHMMPHVEKHIDRIRAVLGGKA